MSEAEIAAWHVNVGDDVREDQPLVDVMTDKATVEIGSPIAARVTAIHVAVGDKAAVGSVLVEFNIADGMQSTSAVQATSDSSSLPAAASPSPPGPASAAPAAALPAAAAGFGGDGHLLSDVEGFRRPLAAPAVRRRARELKIPLSAIVGSGPRGRILHADVEAHAGRRSALIQASVPLGVREEVEEVRIIGLRRKIAERMALAKRSIPHFGYVEEFDVTELEALRIALNHRYGAARAKLTPLPFIMSAIARVIPHHPNINSTYDDESGLLRRFKHIDMGVATRTTGGLVVPVVRRVESRDIWSCASEVARLAVAARNGKATRTELSGSTITVTSLGPLGGIAATPVINHPEVAIIGPNRIQEQPRVLGGSIVVRKIMNVSSSFDHRIIDGYEAAEFIQKVKALIEMPAMLFLSEL